MPIGIIGLFSQSILVEISSQLLLVNRKLPLNCRKQGSSPKDPCLSLRKSIKNGPQVCLPAVKLYRGNSPVCKCTVREVNSSLIVFIKTNIFDIKH